MKKHISEYEFMSDEVIGISAILESLAVVIANSDDYYTNEQKALNLLSHQLQEIAKKCDEVVEIAYNLSSENNHLKYKLTNYEIKEEIRKNISEQEANNG